MRQNLLLFILALKLSVIFLAEFLKESKREVNDKRLYPQTKYACCIERAGAILKSTIERVTKIYALMIAMHRKDCHYENRHAEIDKLKVEMSNHPKDIKYATSRGFWIR